MHLLASTLGIALAKTRNIKKKNMQATLFIAFEASFPTS